MTSQTLKYTMYNKNVLTPDESELHEICQHAGVLFDPQVFKIIVDLLRLNVAPTAIERMLKSMTQQMYGKRGTQPSEGSENIPPSTRGRHSVSNLPKSVSTK